MACDGCGARAIEPEFAARLGADGDETLAAACVGDAHHLGGCAGDRRVVGADDIAEQRHLWQRAAARLGAVAHGAQIALIHMLETRQLHAAGGEPIQVILDLDDGGNRLTRLTKELETHRAGVCGHAMQDPARRGDQAIAALLLHPGQAAEKLVGDVLAEADLAETVPRQCEMLAAQHRCALRRRAAILPHQFELRCGHIVDLAEVVLQARDLEPVALAIDHAPPGEIVDRGAPEDGLLAAGVHRDITADTGGVRRGWVDGEHVAREFGRVGDAFRHDAGL